MVGVHANLPHGELPNVKDVLRRFKGALIAIVVLGLSAGLAFGAEPPAAASWGLSNAAAHAGKTVPVAGGDEEAGDEETGDEETGDDETGDDETGDDETGDDETGDEETGDEEGAEEEGVEGEAGDNCTTDPTTVPAEALALMNHGSIVCWAAHQTEWPEWFANHGAWVRCWAHQGKADAVSCTEDPTAEEPVVEEPAADAEATSAGKGHGKGLAKGLAKGHGKGKAKGHFKP